jgi:hypothetical protein
VLLLLSCTIGALLLSDEVFHKHYLFWGDHDICIATTENLIHYTNTVPTLHVMSDLQRQERSNSRVCVCVCVVFDVDAGEQGKCLLNTRSDKFDSVLVESGPEPMRLSDGNYLFLYNSARK